jgi:excisionase family DNA binding protein
MAMASGQDPIEDTPYLRTAEAARILGKSPKTVSRWARDGRLSHLVTLGGHRRFPAAAVHELARQMGRT